MPVVGIPVHYLKESIGPQSDTGSLIESDKLVSVLQSMGCDIEEFAELKRFQCKSCDAYNEVTENEGAPASCEQCGLSFKDNPTALIEAGTVESIRMDLLAVRPDIFDPGGLGRAVRMYLSDPSGAAAKDEQSKSISTIPDLTPSSITITIDPAYKTQSLGRPFITAAVIRGLVLTSDRIRILMKLQENLQWALGRDRKRAAIGMYDLAKLNGTQFSYTQVAPEGVSFAPLGEKAPATPKAILAGHPKGKHYAHLLKPFDHYPLLSDEADAAGVSRVLSMPPIINADACRLQVGTDPVDIVIDVTGPSQRIIDRCLNILVCNIFELVPGITVEAVRIVSSDGKASEKPDLRPQAVTLKTSYAPSVIGIALDESEQRALLTRMGHTVSCSAPASASSGAATSSSDDVFQVNVPAYRTDIMHPVDLVEDIAIAYGYDNITTAPPATFTRASELPINARSNALRKRLTGMSLFEVINLPLTSVDKHYDALGLPTDNRAILLKNPISTEQTLIRTHLVSGLLETLQANADHPLPQGIFEIGDVGLVLPGSLTSGSRQRINPTTSTNSAITAGSSNRTNSIKPNTVSSKNGASSDNTSENSAAPRTMSSGPGASSNIIPNDTNAAEYRRLAVALIGSEIGYASIRPILEALMRELKLDLSTPALDSLLVVTDPAISNTVDVSLGSTTGDASLGSAAVGTALGSAAVTTTNEPASPSSGYSAYTLLYIPGRCARIVCSGINGAPANVTIGHIGEIHPRILSHYKLSHPTALFELNLSAILR